MFPEGNMKFLGEKFTVPFGVNSVPTLTWGMNGAPRTLSREGSSDDWGVGSKSPRLSDWETEGFGDDRGDAIHAPIEIVQ